MFYKEKITKKTVNLILILTLLPIIPVISFGEGVGNWDLYGDEAMSNIENANQFIYNAFKAERYKDYYGEETVGGKILNPDIAVGIWGGLKTGSHITEDLGIAFTYGAPKNPDWDSSPSFRYIGETFNGSDFTNIYFRHDAFNSSKSFEDRYWIRNPWDQPITGAIEGYFDYTVIQDIVDVDKSYYRDSIINGITTVYGDWVDGRLVEDEQLMSYYDGNATYDIEEFVSILQPPTYYAWGLGRIWHYDNGPWYLTIPLAPFSAGATARISVEKIGEEEIVDTLIVEEGTPFSLLPSLSNVEDENVEVEIKWERNVFKNGFEGWETVKEVSFNSWNEALDLDSALSFFPQDASESRYIVARLTISHPTLGVESSKTINIKIVKIDNELSVVNQEDLFEEMDIDKTLTSNATLVGHTAGDIDRWRTFFSANGGDDRDISETSNPNHEMTELNEVFSYGNDYLSSWFNSNPNMDYNISYIATNRVYFEESDYLVTYIKDGDDFVDYVDSSQIVDSTIKQDEGDGSIQVVYINREDLDNPSFITSLSATYDIPAGEEKEVFPVSAFPNDSLNGYVLIGSRITETDGGGDNIEIDGITPFEDEGLYLHYGNEDVEVQPPNLTSERPELYVYFYYGKPVLNIEASIDPTTKSFRRTEDVVNITSEVDSIPKIKSRAITEGDINVTESSIVIDPYNNIINSINTAYTVGEFVEIYDSINNGPHKIDYTLTRSDILEQMEGGSLTQVFDINFNLKFKDEPKFGGFLDYNTSTEISNYITLAHIPTASVSQAITVTIKKVNTPEDKEVKQFRVWKTDLKENNTHLEDDIDWDNTTIELYIEDNKVTAEDKIYARYNENNNEVVELYDNVTLSGITEIEFMSRKIHTEVEARITLFTTGSSITIDEDPEKMTYTSKINVFKDEFPTAVVHYDDTAYREVYYGSDYSERERPIIEAEIISPDSDLIEFIRLGYIYDADNSGTISEEEIDNIEDIGISWNPSIYPDKSEKSDWDWNEYVIEELPGDSGTKRTYKIENFIHTQEEVGNYIYLLLTSEYISPDETIMEVLRVGDRRSVIGWRDLD